MHLFLSLPSAGLWGVMSLFPLFSPSFQWCVSVTSLLVPAAWGTHTDTDRPAHGDTSHTLWEVNNIASPCWLIRGWSGFSWVALPCTLWWVLGLVLISVIGTDSKLWVTESVCVRQWSALAVISLSVWWWITYWPAYRNQSILLCCYQAP